MRLWGAWAAVATLMFGCAKFPDQVQNNNFTRISIRFRVEAKINTSADDDPLTNYIYIVAIRASSEVNPDHRTNPQPIFSPNPNGFVAGEPTHFVEFDSQNPQTSLPYTLYRFAKTGDPDTPIDIGVFTPASPVISFVRPIPGGSELGFDLFVNQLADTEAEARALQSLQVNILTMNRKALSTTAGRVQDFLGRNPDVTDLNKAIRVDLRTSNTRVNTPDYEPPGDTADPDLDITDWSIVVSKV